MAGARLDDYDAVYYPGGHGPMADLWKDADSGRLLTAALASGKPLAIVCHAPVAMLATRRNGVSPFAGYRVTAYTNDEEDAVGLRSRAFWTAEDELVKQLVARNQRTPEPLLRTYAHFGTKKRDDGRLIWKRDPNLVKGFVVTELWAHVSKITSPTLYVIGGASRIVPAAAQERLKQTLPNVQIVTMPGLGHYPNEENTAGFLAIINPFLKR